MIKIKLFKPSLRNRFFISLVLLVFVAASIIATVTVFQYRDESERYQQDKLERVVKSIEASIDYQIENTTYPVETKYIELIFRDKIYEISHIHDTRIKLYDLDGKLLKSSRATYLNQADSTYLSERILNTLKNSAENRFSYNYVDDEGHRIQSSFSYITDAHFKPLAILSIPHIEGDGFLERELRYFLVVLGQVYLIMILAAVVLSYLFSRYITKSLSTVSEKIFTTRVDQKNQKIEIERIPMEIRSLVEAYNSMVDELEESANKLAASEREQAWREMAKQVAHEVKNPLTPMRLSVQSFERNFVEGEAANKEKVKKFSKIMIEQIDTMSAVASAFSDFAKMPQPKNEIIDLVEVVKTTVDIFNEGQIEFKSSKDEIHLHFDRVQLTRIITNLVKNAIQATKNKTEPHIQIEVLELDEEIEIKITDNGEGISKENAQHIFEPKFTTRSSGMGLGLGISKQIVQFYKGEIAFESKVNEGTTFTVQIPKNQYFMKYQNIYSQTENFISTLVINRPNKLNALNKETLEEISRALSELEKDENTRVVILTGAGQKAFVAGADIAEFAHFSVEEGTALAREGQEKVFDRIENFAKPIIAAVNGFALGGGLELAMAAHFRIASRNARMGLPETSLGLIPGYGGSQRLPQLIGKGRALEMIMTAGMIDAQKALEYGLVNHVVELEDLITKAEEIAQKIISNSSTAVSTAIKAVNVCFDKTQNGFEKEIELFGESFGTRDFEEGTRAFLEKRKASFPGN